MTSQDAVNRFFKRCAGISLVICSIGFLVFSLKYNPAMAGPLSPHLPTVAGYTPIGIGISGRTVTVYGYDPNPYLANKITILASEQP